MLSTHTAYATANSLQSLSVMPLEVCCLATAMFVNYVLRYLRAARSSLLPYGRTTFLSRMVSIIAPMASRDTASGEWSPQVGGPAFLPWEDDRRTTDRRTFLSWQHVALSTAGDVFQSSDFQRVRCLDLSPYGMSFLLDQEPTATTLVVSFGDPSDGTFIAAEIVCVEAVVIENQSIHRVGCRFVGQRFTR